MKVYIYLLILLLFPSAGYANNDSLQIDAEMYMQT